ncbi:MAG: molybdopterin-dependent oxidoreductase, partial [Pacificimonas sp.]
DLVDLESMTALKDLLGKLGSNRHECRQDGAQIGGEVSSERASYLFNIGLAPLETADVVLLIGANPRWEAPLVNTRIRKAVRHGRAKVFAIGPEVDLTYRTTWLGEGADLLTKLPTAAMDALKAAERPAIIVGQGALARADGAQRLADAEALAQQVNVLRDDWTGFGVLHTAAARVGGLDLGFTTVGGTKQLLCDAEDGTIKALFLHGADEIETAHLTDTFKIYIGHHGDRGAHGADVILPAASFAEKSATWVNMEGRVQRSDRATFPPGDAREDWAILRALSDVLGVTLPYDDMNALRARIASEWPWLGQPGLASAKWADFDITSDSKRLDAPYHYPIDDYYMTNAVARASEVMHQCAKVVLDDEQPMLEAAE